MEPNQPEAEHPHHRSARERQRRGPMWTFMRRMTITIVVVLGLLALILGGGWWYLGTTSFAELVKLRVEKTLEARLGRDVSIHDVQIVRSQIGRVIVNDVRIANSPGAVHPYFATVKQIVITGGIDSFWGRKINVSRIDIIGPHLYFEVYPAGSKLVHNFPKWASGPKSRYDIVHLDLGTMYVTGGAFDFLDRKHDLAVAASNMTSQINVTGAEDVYAGTVASTLVRMRVQDYAPFDLDLRGQFRYTDNALELQSVAMRGDGLALFARGRIAPLADAAYNLHLTSEVALQKVKQIFRVNKTLEGVLAIDGTMRGRQGTFALDANWRAPKVKADVYELTSPDGRLHVTDTGAAVDVATAKYGGGTIAAHYVLPKFAEPYPQTVDLRYNNVSLEKLFSDWTIEGTGMRGGVTGRLGYHWDKDKVLEGAGEGSARLGRSAVAFSDAKYPVALTGGGTDFTLDNGVVTFRNGELVTEASTIGFSGKLRIQDAWTDLLLKIHSGDFAELDRAAYNFAHSAGKATYDLLGLGGAGDITGSVQGKLKTPHVVARIVAAGTKYNNVDLGESEIDLKYDGGKGVLTFDKATFRDANGGRLGLNGTITFLDSGPSPRFDLAVDAVNYPIDRAIATVNLKLAVSGIGTGKLLITGTPDQGRAHFVNLVVKQKTAELKLNGDVNWNPGKGNVAFDLDIGTRDFPVADIAKFLDLGTVPVTGDVTGTLHLAGTKAKLGGSGSVIVRKGTIAGEPVDEASADINFTEGTLNAKNVSVTSPAGTIKGEARFNMATNEFSYSISSASIDLSRLKVLSSLASLLGGNLVLTSSGAGTLEHPEVVLEATLNQATLKGLNLPPDVPPPSLYLAIRNNRLIVRGSAAGVLTIEGDGALATDGTLDGLIRIKVTDVAKLAAMSPKTADLPVAGSVTIDLKLGGKLTSIEALRIDGNVPQLDLKVSEHQFTAPQPLTFALRDGRLLFQQFSLAHGDSTFAVTGYADVTGKQQLAVNVKGEVEAALLQLFVPGMRADGHVNITGGVTGTVASPRLSGSAEIQDATVRFTGFPQVLDHINGTLIFKGDRVEIDSLRTNVGGGTAVVGGFIALDGLTPKNVRVTLQGTDVALRYYEGLTIEGDFNIVVSGDAERAVVTGDVNVKRGLYFKDIDFGAAVLNVVLSRKGVAPVVAASWQDRVALRVHVVAPGTLAVKNNLADLTGSADLDVSGTLSSPVILGVVNLDEGGHFAFQNIDYRLVRGSINFQNPFRIDPYFDVTLEARVSGGISEIESGPLDVTVTLTGTLDRMTPSISSDPPASDITLFSLLGVGSFGNSSGATPTNFSASLAGRSLLFQSLSRALGTKVLPFADTFSYDPGTLEATGDPGPKFTFEKRVSGNIRILVVYATHDSKSKEIIEWQANPDWTLQITRDELSNELRVEARFRRRYEGHWTLGRSAHNAFSFPTVASAVAVPQSLTIAAQPNAAPLAPSSAPASSQMAFDEQPIVTVMLHSDAAADLAALRQYVSLRAGERLTIRNTQATIKALFGTGDFRDVRVNAVAATGGVAVTVNVSLNYRVADIRFDGITGMQRARLERDINFHRGDILSLNAIDRSGTAVQQQLAHNGYLDATVDPETSFDRASSRALVTYHVTRGTQAQVAQVTIEGNPAPYTEQQLIQRMKHGPGKTFVLADARSDADRIRTYLIRNDYRKADVRYLGDHYDPATKQVTLRYHVATGPKVRVSVDGFHPRYVRRLLPFSRNQAYSEDVIDKAAQDITTALQENGYYHAAVDTETSLANNVWTSTFHIIPGQQYHLAGVAFTGNEKIDDKTLATVVTTSPRSGFFTSIITTIFRRPTGVTRPQLSADRDALESYYRLNGFSEAKVGTPAVTTSGDQMAVEFPITEGPQTLLTDVTVEGAEQVAVDKLPKPILKPGDPLNPQTERADIVALQTYYADRGNAEVQVKVREEVAADKTTAKVTYVIAEGPKINIDDVVVRGNTYTNTSVIRRQAQIEKGEPFSYTKILEAQRALYALGIFKRVDVQPEQAGTSVGDRNVVIAVEEGRDLAISGSVGLASALEGSNKKLVPRVAASISHRNLFGTGRYLGLEVIAAQGNQQEVFLTYREPFVGKWEIPVQFTLFQNDQRRRNAHIRERGAGIEASRVARFQTRWALRYEYRIANCIVESPNDICARAQNSLIPGLDRTYTNIAISSITPTFFWDRRDDAIDPHKGFFTSASAEYAFKTFAADARFLKESAQGSWYLPVSQRSVFAVSARVGLIQPLGPEVRDESTGLMVRGGVPISEKFTAGGDTSHRAYPLDLLGTVCPDKNDTSCHPTLISIPGSDGTFVVAPIGGNSMFVLNAEYRFPIAGPIGGTLFADAGNTFFETKIQFGDLRYGVGGGIRYISPVGPIRFDVGYKLHRQVIGLNNDGSPVYERPFAYFVTLGYAF
jgi:outer membrane protein insertion porin family